MGTLKRVGVLLGFATLSYFALAPAVSATFPGRNGLIVFQAQTDAGVQVFTMRPNGHEIRQITHLDGDVGGLDWSPNGRRITFTLNECTIGMMDADGANVSFLAAPPADGVPGVDFCEGDSSFTPDGEHIVFEHYNAVLDVDAVWSMGIDGTGRRLVTTAGGPDPNVSPDGTRVSFKGEGGALYSTTLDGSDLRRISPVEEVAFKHDWAPDGSHLVFTDVADPDPGVSNNIATVRPDGTGLRYLTHLSGGDRAYVGGYSPNGHWIIFRLERNGQYAIYRMNTDGGALHQILPFSSFRPRGLDWGTAVRP
jgi:Tol biopolymer transport system component